MLDFPNNPALDDVFQRWRWDGQAWVSADGGGGAGGAITVRSDTSGRLEYFDGTNWQEVQLGGGSGNRVELTRLVFSSGSSNSVSMWWDFDDTYDVYEIDIYDLIFSASDPGFDAFNMQFSVDGSTFLSTNYVDDQELSTRSEFPLYRQKSKEGTLQGPMEQQIRFAMPYLNNSFKSFRWSGVVPRLQYPTDPTSKNRPFAALGVGTHLTSIVPIKGFRFFTGTGGTLMRGTFVLYGMVKGS